MHTEVKDFIRLVKGKFGYKFRLKKVLEVGSKYINGSVRKYFWFCNYTGVDIGRGKGVDLVGHLADVKSKLIPNFDTVISTEALEHDKRYIESLQTMYHMLNDGGLLIVTCAGPHREEHGTAKAYGYLSPDTNDYYGNVSVEDFEKVLPPSLFSVYVLQYTSGKSDLQFYGIKKITQMTSRDIYRALIKSTTK